MSSGSAAITTAIRGAVQRNRPALVAFLTAGFPSREHFRAHLEAVASVADVVEIGVPFTDPMADGVTIQRASHAALGAGVSLRWILKQLAETHAGGAPRLLMSYLNPLLAFGLSELPDEAARAGVAGFIVPDLPYEERAELGAALNGRGLALVQMVTPVTPPESTGPVVTFARQNISGTDIPRKLQAGRVNVRLSTHWMRLSPSVYNDMADIERFLEVLS